MIANLIRQDETWLTLDPRVGCGMNCQYCFLRSYNQTPKLPLTMASPEDAVRSLLQSSQYSSKATIMLGSETDAFMNRSNAAFFEAVLEQISAQGLKNTIALVTKCRVPDSFIQSAQCLGNQVVFYLSLSGLSRDIEPNVRHDRLVENFKRLYEAGLPVIHYWRPIVPQNATEAAILEVIRNVVPFARCSVVSGLKLNANLQKLIWFWPEVRDRCIDFQRVGAVWPAGAKERIVTALDDLAPEYPVYWVNSCALSHVRRKADFNGMHGTSICRDNRCPVSQRKLCGDSLATSKQRAVEAAKGLVGKDVRIHINNKGEAVIGGTIGHDQAMASPHC